MVKQKAKDTEALNFSVGGAVDASNVVTTTTEAPKNKKSKNKEKAQEPTLSRDVKKELKLTGTFYAGIASMKVEKSDLELSRTQRIILEENGVHYEYMRIKGPY